MNDKQIKHMVDRFLGWKLPENFRPDGGVSFKPTFNDHLPKPMSHNPSGTNLLDASQTLEMVKYMLEGLPEESKPIDGADWFWDDLDPDDSGDNPQEALRNYPNNRIALINSSYKGPSFFAARVKQDNESDDETVIVGATEAECMAKVAAHLSTITEDETE